MFPQFLQEAAIKLSNMLVEHIGNFSLVKQGRGSHGESNDVELTMLSNLTQA